MQRVMSPFATQPVSLEIKYNFFDMEELEMTPEEIVLDLTESLAINNLQMISGVAIQQQPELYARLPECLARTSYLRTFFFSTVTVLSRDEIKSRNLRPSIERYNRICVQLKEGEQISLD
ncbi:MAG: hypothetical protein IJA79_07865 [Desulfovibrio sp.]|nr:hypothetical protein [Desulfovibrio sp.]